MRDGYDVGYKEGYADGQRSAGADATNLERMLDASEKEKKKYMKEASELRRDCDGLVEVLKLAYRKHVIDDDNVGWDELTDHMVIALTNVMGDDWFCKWLDNEFNVGRDELTDRIVTALTVSF